MNFWIVIPGLRNMSGVGSQHDRKAEASAVIQTVKPRVISIFDDCEVVEKHIGDVWDRIGKHGAAQNIEQGIDVYVKPHAKDEDIVCILDGDDWLRDDHSLEPVAAAYRDPNVWVTHGSYTRVSGDNRTFNGGYNSNSKISVRSRRWHGSHLKTFRFGLWKHLPIETLLGPDGVWLQTCSDVALMFILMELAGLDRVRFIKQKIYVYNDENPLNDHKIHAKEQIETDKWLRSLKPSERIDSL